MTSVAKRSSCSRQTDLGTQPRPLLDQHPVEPRIAFFQSFEAFDDLLGRAAQHAAGFDCIFDTWQVGAGRAVRIAHDLDLLVAQSPRQPQLAEHLQIFFVKLGGLSNSALAALGDVTVETDAEPLAEFEVLTEFGMSLLPGEHDIVGGPPLGGTTSDAPLSPPLGHEGDRARGTALDRLPAFDRPAQRSRHQGQALWLGAPISAPRA